MHLLLISLVVVLIGFANPLAAFEGPLEGRNYFPLFNTLNSPVHDSAAVKEGLSLGISHSSLYMMRQSSEWETQLDMEITAAVFRYQKVFFGNTEFGIEVPFLMFESGFMDGFLESYHKTFGFPDYGRSERPKNSFLYNLKRNNQVLIAGNGGRPGIGDIKLSAKRVIYSEGPVISLKGEIELPTGKAKEGFGNGSIDGAVYLLTDAKLGRYFMGYGALGGIFPGNVRAYQTIDTRPSFYGSAALEYKATDNLSLNAQFSLQTSPYPNTGISQVDRAAMLITVGGQYRTGKTLLELSLTEDPNTSGAPDFSINLKLKYAF